MSVPVIQFQNVWKKFRRGERHDSLRDLVPGVMKRMFSRNTQVEVKAREFWCSRPPKARRTAGSRSSAR